MDLKIHIYPRLPLPGMPKSTLKIMKLTAIILLAACMQVHAKGYSQITLSEHNTPLQKVFQKIQQQSGYDFVSTYEVIKEAGNVTVNVRNASLQQALEECLRGKPLTYTIIEKTIVIQPRKQDPYPAGTKAVTETLAPPPVEIRGRVVNENGEPLQNASVLIAGTRTGTTTNNDGYFTIASPNDRNVVLEVSSVGYQTIKISVGKQREVNVILEETVSELREIVVGYGTQKKTTLSGSVSTIGSKVFENLPLTNSIEALQGNLPGAIIQRINGQPGLEGYSIDVRGYSSVNGTTSALVIIDGVPGDLSKLNPNDIKSVSVLKDAAASIYGARAAGGVLLVTTKQGKTSKPQIEVNVSSSLTKPVQYFEQPNSLQAAEMMLEAAKNAGQNNPYVDEQFYEDLKAGNVHPVDLGWGTIFTGSWNYAKLGIGTGNQQNYDVSLSGSSRNSHYRASIGYMREKGVLKYGADNSARLNARLNYDYDINNKLKINTILGFSRQRTQAPAYTGAFTRMNAQMPFMRPTVVEDDTKWATTQKFYNPLQMLDEGGVKNFENTEIQANLKLDYQPWSDLTFTGQVGSNYIFQNASNFNRTVNLYDPVNGNVSGYLNNPNSATEENNRSVYYTVIGYANYAKNFGDVHNVSITLGGSHEENKNRFFSAGRMGFPSNDFFSLNLGDGQTQTNNSSGSDWAINSLFGRGTYIYNNKYIFDLNFRNDGSSRFAPDSRWGLFWGASAAWRLSEENFIKNLNAFSDLKLRLSYGETGNQDGIGLYDYIQSIIIEGIYPFGNGRRDAYARPGPLVDPNRTWETIQTKNIGLDFGLVKGKLTGSFDYFIKNNKDMLVPVILPSVLGAPAPAGNNGTLKAWGWEFLLNWNDRINKDWSYNIGFNLSDNQNKITKYSGQDTYAPGLVHVREGYPINTWYGYVADGIIKDQAQLESYKKLTGVHGNIGIGDAMYKDVNGDGQISIYGANGTSGDVIPIGSPTPRYLYGVRLGLQFKTFEFSAMLQGVGKKDIQLGGDWYMPFPQPWVIPNIRWYHNTWSQERPDNLNPRLTLGDTRSWNYQISTRTLLSAAYTRLKNISIAYNFPPSLLKHIGFQKAKMYVVGYDVWTRQHIGGGVDAETLNVVGTKQYVQQTEYPFSSRYTVGLNLMF